MTPSQGNSAFQAARPECMKNKALPTGGSRLRASSCKAFINARNFPGSMQHHLRPGLDPLVTVRGDHRRVKRSWLSWDLVIFDKGIRELGGGLTG